MSQSSEPYKAARCDTCYRWMSANQVGQSCPGWIMFGNEGDCPGTIEETPDAAWKAYLDAGGA